MRPFFFAMKEIGGNELILLLMIVYFNVVTNWSVQSFQKPRELR